MGIRGPIQVVTSLFVLSSLGCLNSDLLFNSTALVTVKTESESSPASTPTYVGCSSAAALDIGRIQVKFEFPAGATQITVLRDGIPITSTMDSKSDFYIDTKLNEGQAYKYTCQATIDGKILDGAKPVVASTLAINAPVFAGIKEAIGVSSNSVRITWLPPSTSGVPASYFKIFATHGNSVDFSVKPKATPGSSSFSYLIEGLGDEIAYSFAVRACTADDICDVNTTKISVTTPDGGAPTSVGAATATTGNKLITVNAPWKDHNGAVSKRNLYYKIGGTKPALTSAALSSQGFLRASVVQNSTPSTSAPPLTISMSAQDNTQYWIVVQDQDEAGNLTDNSRLNVLNILTGDLTAPTFTGLSSAKVGSNPAGNAASSHPDTTVTLGFNAIAREGTSDSGNAAGASLYLVYATSAPYPSLAAADPCANGTLLQSFSAGTYAPGASTYVLTGLKPRTNYGFCLKAADSGLNESDTSTAISLTTLDITPPNFDGIQSLSFDNATASLRVTWNPSPSVDLSASSAYRVTYWSKSTSPSGACSGAACTTVFKGSAFTSGATFTKSDFPFADNDTIYVAVDACDNADTIPGGTGNLNCNQTSFSYPSQGVMSLVLPDIAPPKNFGGILSATDTAPVQEGSALVKWVWPPSPAITAAELTDYAGFYIYDVISGATSTLNLLAVCPCAVPGQCGGSVSDTQCTLTGLVSHKTYHFHVRPYDAANNISPIGTTTNLAYRIKDKTAPSFTPAIQFGPGPQFPLSWSQASDNQCGNGTDSQCLAETTPPVSVITYEVFRSFNQAFADATNPGAIGAGLGKTTSLGFTDTQARVEGATYYYVVCAMDAQSNRTCGGNRSVTASDATAPAFSTGKEPKMVFPGTTTAVSSTAKKWDLYFEATDSVTQAAAIKVSLYEKNTTGAPQDAAKSDTTVFADSVQYTTAVNGVAQIRIPNLVGPSNANQYVNYLVVIKDQAGNESTYKLSRASNNILSLSSISRSRGPLSGGKIVLLQGTGFYTEIISGSPVTSHVTIGSDDCTNLTVWDSTRMSCTTPVSTESIQKNVTVTNPDGTTATITSGYTYDQTNTPDVCDQAAPNGADFQAGNGTSASPYILCTAAQLNNVKKTSPNYLGGSYYYQLGDNIDIGPASGFTGPIGYIIGSPYSAVPFKGSFDGNGLALFNYTLNTPTTQYAGLFGYIDKLASGANSIVKNLKVIGVYVAGSSYVGGLAGDPTYVDISNISVSGYVQGGGISIGGIGGVSYGATYKDCSFSGTVKHTATAGVPAYTAGMGGLVGTMTLVNNIVNVDSCSINATIDAPYAGAVGGLVGNLVGGTASSIIQNSSVSGSITAGQHSTGGLVGYWQNPSATIKRNSVSGTVTHIATSGAGGLIGGLSSYNSTVNILQNFVAAKITGYTAGGLIGAFYYAISNSTGVVTISDNYTTGDVAGTLDVGGLIGLAAQISTATAPISRNYSSGKVTGTTNVGGFLGRLNVVSGTNTVTFNDNFWDTTTSTQSASAGGAGVMGKTTVQLQDQGASAFTNWDIDSSVVPIGTTSTHVWKWPAANGTYPVLGWQ